jgi:nitroreductase
VSRPSDHDVLSLIQGRRSPRAFDPSRDVTDAALRQMFEAARWAPSSHNAQPWRFIVASRRRAPEAFQALWATLDAGNQAWAEAAPVLVLVAIAGGSNGPAALYDAGGAMGYLTLQATSAGLSVRQIQGFDTSRARAAARIPEGFDPLVIAAIGYQGDPASLASERHRAAETGPRERKALAEIVFNGVWGAGF